MENESFSCVFLGVSDESKACRLYDPISKRIIISRDVAFEEDKQWDWDASYEEQLLMNLELGDEIATDVEKEYETVSETSGEDEEIVDNETPIGKAIIADGRMRRHALI